MEIVFIQYYLLYIPLYFVLIYHIKLKVHKLIHAYELVYAHWQDINKRSFNGSFINKK